MFFPIQLSSYPGRSRTKAQREPERGTKAADAASKPGKLQVLACFCTGWNFGMKMP